MQRIECVVSGKVQGVSYRAFVLQTAVSLGLTGTVKNLASGEVEVVAEGKKEKLRELVSLLRKGPPLSRVEGVNVSESGALGSFRNFAIIY